MQYKKKLKNILFILINNFSVTNRRKQKNNRW